MLLVLPESDDRIFLANVALRLVLGSFGGCEPVQHREPHHGLRLLLQPLEEVECLDVL